MNQSTQNETVTLKPKGFASFVTLCIVWGVYGLFSRMLLWLLPFGKTVPSQLSVNSLIGVIQTVSDLGLILGGIYVLKKHNWARLFILFTATAKILDWLYGAIVYMWMFRVISLFIWSLPSLLVVVVIAIYFSRPSVKAYMN